MRPLISGIGALTALHEGTPAQLAECARFVSRLFSSPVLWSHDKDSAAQVVSGLRAAHFGVAIGSTLLAVSSVPTRTLGSFFSTVRSAPALVPWSISFTAHEAVDSTAAALVSELQARGVPSVAEEAFVHPLLGDSWSVAVDRTVATHADITDRSALGLLPATSGMRASMHVWRHARPHAPPVAAQDADAAAPPSAQPSPTAFGAERLHEIALFVPSKQFTAHTETLRKLHADGMHSRVHGLLRPSPTSPALRLVPTNQPASQIASITVKVRSLDDALDHVDALTDEYGKDVVKLDWIGNEPAVVSPFFAGFDVRITDSDALLPGFTERLTPEPAFTPKR